MECYVHVDKIRKFVENVFESVGVPETDAKICADVLIAADLRGIDSHGINRLKMYVDRISAGVQYPVTDWKLLSDNNGTAIVDACHGMGQVASYHATKIAIEKAKKYGISIVTVKNSTHYGIAGYYGLMASEEGMIGLSFTNARPSIPPTFSSEPLMGTNPICMVAPTNLGYPFFYDAATSIVQRGKIEFYEKTGKGVPSEWIITHDGKNTNDASKILKMLESKEAALLPLGGSGEEMGGYKGYGLALIVEILSALLANGPYLDALSGIDESGKKTKFALGHTFIVINIEHFLPRSVFLESITALLKRLQAAEKANDAEKVYVPGEKEAICLKISEEKGIFINESMHHIIKALSSTYGIRVDFTI